MRRSMVPTVTLFAAVLVVAAASLGAAAGARAVPGAAASEPGQLPTPAPTATPGCRVVHSKVAEPPTITLGSEVGITMTARLDCGMTHGWLHVVIAVEGTQTVAGDAGRRVKDAARDIVRILDLGVAGRTSPGVASYVGVVSFEEQARTLLQLSADESRVLAAIDRVRPQAGGARAARGLTEAWRVLRDGRRDRPGATEVVVLFTNGHSVDGCAEDIREAAALQGQGVLVMTVCSGENCDTNCVRQMASSSSYYFELDDLGGLRQIWQYIGSWLSSVTGRAYITDTLAAGVALVPGSARPTPLASDTAGRWLRWGAYPVPASGLTITLRVRPSAPGRQATNLSAIGRMRDAFDRDLEWTFDVPFVTVLGGETPSSTPGPTERPTATSSPTSPTPATPTGTATAPATPTPTRPTPTPDASIVFLPVAARGGP